jgi:Type IV secretion system pilin
VKGISLMDAINTLFNNLLNIGLGVAVTVAAFYLMVGAFLYMSASGSPHQMERGKSAMLNALAGLAVVLAAKVIAGMIQSALAGA